VTDRFLSQRPPVPPLGFTLPGSPGENLGQSLPRPPLTRLADAAANHRTNPRHRVSFGLRLAPPDNVPKHVRPRQPS
jgi:hypothetical protein